MDQPRTTRRERLNGRVVHPDERPCEEPGCGAPGEFKAPREGRMTANEWRWLCLDHVRAFNARYNYFEGMSADEIAAAQGPNPSWERAARAFASNGYADRLSFEDNLELIRLRFGVRAWEEARARSRPVGPTGRPLSPADEKALSVLELAPGSGPADLRRRYAELLRRYHPDRNGGDRRHEGRLNAVIEAYSQLRSSPAFAANNN